MKKIIFGLIIGIMVSTTVPAFAKMIFDNSKVQSVGDTWTIYNEGEIMNMDDPSSDEDYLILNYNGRTYVPFRLIAETAGYDSEAMWQAERPKDINLIKSSDVAAIEEEKVEEAIVEEDPESKTLTAVFETNQEPVSWETREEVEKWIREEIKQSEILPSTDLHNNQYVRNYIYNYLNGNSTIIVEIEFKGLENSSEVWYEYNMEMERILRKVMINYPQMDFNLKNSYMNY